MDNNHMFGWERVTIYYLKYSRCNLLIEGIDSALVVLALFIYLFVLEIVVHEGDRTGQVCTKIKYL